MSFLAYIDGAARGNPGPAGAGVYVEPDGDRPAEELFEGLGNQTNNVAEYSALLLALTRAAEIGADEVELRSDSRLLVEQVNGNFKVKAPHLKPIVADAIVRAMGGRIWAENRAKGGADVGFALPIAKA